MSFFMPEDNAGTATGYLRLLDQLAKDAGVKVYVVGGAVRDLLLGRPLHDIDLLVDRDVAVLVRRWAKRLGGKFVFLHSEPATVRVVLKGKGKRHFLIWDLVEQGEEGMEENLRGRDFTVNAMALPFNIFIAASENLIVDSCVFAVKRTTENSEPSHFCLSKSCNGDGSDRESRAATVNTDSTSRLFTHLIDPCGGWNDLKSGLIRPCRSDALARDPLRVLRALRLAGELGFDLAEETLAQIKQYAAGLETVAGERIGEEMGKIMNLSSCVPLLRLLLEWDLPVALPFSWRRSFSAEEGLNAVKRLEQLCMSFIEVSGQFLRSYLLLPYSGNRGRLAVMKLAALFNALPEAEAGLGVTCRRWCWSRREEQLAQRLLTNFQAVREALCPYSSRTEEEKTAALFRLWRQSGEEWPGFIIWTGAVCSGCGSDPNGKREGCQPVVNHLIEEWKNKQLPWQNVQPLLTAEEIGKTLGLKPSPLLGRVVTEVLTAQVAGQIKSREEAEALAISIIQKYQRAGDQR